MTTLIMLALWSQIIPIWQNGGKLIQIGMLIDATYLIC